MLAFLYLHAGLMSLERVGLDEQFAPAFAAAGVSTEADLALLTDDDLVSLGLSLVQRRRLQRRLGNSIEEVPVSKRDSVK